MTEQKREHYRVDYPVAAERPIVVVDENHFDVIDVSESGLKIRYKRSFGEAKSSFFKGTVRFQDGESFEVYGSINRFEPESGDCVVQLTKGIPLSKIVAEQQRLIRKLIDETDLDRPR